MHDEAHTDCISVCSIQLILAFWMKVKPDVKLNSNSIKWKRVYYRKSKLSGDVCSTRSTFRENVQRVGSTLSENV